jgi:hypothetical protein
MDIDTNQFEQDWLPFCLLRLISVRLELGELICYSGRIRSELGADALFGSSGQQDFSLIDLESTIVYSLAEMSASIELTSGYSIGLLTLTSSAVDS